MTMLVFGIYITDCRARCIVFAPLPACPIALLTVGHLSRTDTFAWS